MLAAFRILSGLFLLWYLILPDQNYQLMFRLSAGAATIWLSFVAIFRSRNLFSTGIFLCFCLLLAFHVRAAASAGWMIYWYLLFCWTQWAVILRFAARGEFFEGTLFLVIVFISPFYWPILHARNPTFIGLSLWIVALTHCIWLLLKEGQVRLPRSVVLLLAVSLLPVPFAVYSWRAFQFFWIQTSCLLLYCVVLFSPARRLKPVVCGSLFLSFSMVAYALFNDFFTIRQAGIAVLAMRHHVLEHANTLAPLYIIISGILLYSYSMQMRPAKRLVIAAIAAMAILEFLTYSRNGWFGYSVFLIVFAALSLLRNKQVRNRRIMAAAIIVVPLLLLLLTPVKKMVFERLFDRASVSSRVFTWKLGWNTVRENPVVGAGWFNYYVHAAQPVAGGPFNDLARNVALRDVHNHSLFLDLAEAGGLPLLLAFVTVLATHFARAFRNSALIAALIGVTVNNALDTASLWLTVYPHFWILMAFAMDPGHGSTPPAKRSNFAPIVLTVLLFLVPGISFLVEDHFLQRARFNQLNQRESRAISELSVAKFVAPFDAVPLEALNQIHLSRMDAAASSSVLKKLMGLKKNYGPYFAQMAAIDLATKDLDAAANNLRKAQELDPFTTLGGKTYFLLAELQRRQSLPDHRETLYRYLMARAGEVDFRARDLIGEINEQQFLAEAFQYLEQSANEWDRPIAILHLYENLMSLHKPDLAAAVLSLAVKRGPEFIAYESDRFCYLLAKHYGNRKSASEIRQLLLYTSENWASLVRAHHELAKGNFAEAKMHLMKASDSHSYEDMAQSWEAYWRATRSEEGLRTHFKILQRLPRQEFNPWWQGEIARTYFREKKFQLAASEFQRLTSYDYSNPEPHWLQARSLWLAGDPEASKINGRLSRFISMNAVYQNLYRSEIVSVAGQEARPIRTSLHNALGGALWRTGIYAHPPATIKLPPGLSLRSISGQLSFIDGVPFDQTDGADFTVSTRAGTKLFSIRFHPNEQTSAPFRWHGDPQALVLQTGPVINPNYDWIVVTIDSAR